MEKELKFDIKKLSPHEQEELRKKIVREMIKRDGDTKEVAEICECSIRHVQSTWKKYKESGIKAIKSVKMGRPTGVGCRLTEKQEKQIKKILTNKRPCEVGLTGYLWDRKAVSEIIKRKLKIEMPLSTTGDYLAKWKFTAQRPKKHYKQDEKEIRKWLDVTYPEIAKRAKAENAEIWWIDEVGMQNTSNYIKGYSPQGITPTIPVATKHIRVNMVSAITSGGKVRFHFYSGKMTQDKFKGFLIHIMKKTDKKVFTISDNLSAHIGMNLKKWAGENSGKIELFFLPYYAPNLNPAEYLNNNLKYETARKGYAKDKVEIETNSMNIMRSFASKKNRIASFFEHNDVKYAKLDEK